MIALCYILFFLLTPPFQIPDEPEHFENIYWVAKLQYPIVSPNFKPNPHPFIKDFNTIFSLGNHSPMSIYNYSKIQQSKIEKITEYPKATEKGFIPQTSEAYNPPLYYMVGAVFFKVSQVFRFALLSQLYMTRLASGLFYFATVFVAWKILKKLFKNPKTTKGLLLFFSLNPLFLKAGVGINPDIALVFFTTLFSFVALQKNIQRQAIVLGLIASLATLSKFSGVFLVVAFPIFLLLSHSKTKVTLQNTVLFVGTFLLTQIPWEIFTFFRYHKLLLESVALGTTTPLTTPPFWKVPTIALLEFRHTFMHFAGFLGWNDVHPGPEIYIPFALFLALFIGIGIFFAFKQKGKEYRLFAYIFIGLFVFLYILSLHHTLFYPGWDIQGRYLLPVWLPMVLLCTLGMQKLSRLPMETIATGLGYFGLFYYFFITFIIFIPRFYV